MGGGGTRFERSKRMKTGQHFTLDVGRYTYPSVICNADSCAGPTTLNCVLYLVLVVCDQRPQPVKRRRTLIRSDCARSHIKRWSTESSVESGGSYNSIT